MTTNQSTAVATNGDISINLNRRNRSRRMTLDLSEATVTQILYAREASRQKSNSRSSLAAAIAIIEELEEAGRHQAETTILPDGSRAEWAGPYMPGDIDEEFWIDFEVFVCTTPGQYGKQRHSSTCETYANQIIAALRWATTYGAKPAETFTKKKFSKYEKKKVTPSRDMISLMYHYDLDCKENRKRIRELAKEMKMTRFSFTKLKQVRDHFVFGCSNGQRISDSKRITPANFTGYVYETTQQKTGNHARVDLQKCAIDFDVVREILERYGYYAPAFMMDTGNYNKYLHLLCRAIGGPFNRVIHWGNKTLGNVAEESAPFWKLMTSHVARRTYATMKAEDGKNLLQLMAETGHSDIRNLNKYFAPDHR